MSNITKAVCPCCNKEATSSEEIEKLFGFRVSTDKIKHQSYCMECRSNPYVKVDNNPNSTNLEYVKIIGLFGRYNINLNFDKGVNIYIGENGLGKTTILNCVYFLLTKQFDKLLEIDFNKIHIRFKKLQEEKVISKDDLISYNDKRLHRRGYSSDTNYMEHMLNDLLGTIRDSKNIELDILEFATRKIARTFNLPTMQAKRIVFNYVDTGRIENLQKTKKGNLQTIKQLTIDLDANIDQKILYLTTYRRIEGEFSSLINMNREFRETDTLIQFGMTDVDNIIKEILTIISTESLASFNNMTGVLLKQYAQPNRNEDEKPMLTDANIRDVKIILNRLSKQIDEDDKNGILNLLKKDTIYSPEYSYLLGLIQKLIEAYDKQKKYDEKIINFTKICNKYLNDKEFIYDQSNLSLDIHLSKKTEGGQDMNNNIIKLRQLSSGEKQIVSLFSKLYLDNERDTILIIDEPELSLSLKWQRMLLPDIMRSANCKLMLTVTHSPFIFENEFDTDANEMRNCIKTS